jgi:hypothetical protein
MFARINPNRANALWTPKNLQIVPKPHIQGFLPTFR